MKISTANLEAYLAEADQRFGHKEQMIGSTLKSPGYHTQIPDGTWVHATREALDYAVALLYADTLPRTERATNVIRKVLTLQDTNPTNATYGIWPWFLEEPLTEMAPPDWNWADFCGARLLHVVHEHIEKLPADLISDLRESLGHAAWSIFRRNVQPSYTNIAIMGAGVTLAVGELLDEPRLVEYGRERLQNMLDHTIFHGGFNEYNSPTYTIVAIHECERILQLVEDEVARDITEKLHSIAWETIADHYHPGTGQWAGPHSRTYRDLLPASLVAFFNDATGLQLPVHPRVEAEQKPNFSYLQHLPCPSHLVPRFEALPKTPLEMEQRFIRRTTPEASVVGHTWLNEEACLGTINFDSMWTQRRGLLAYWRSDEDPAVMLRLRFLHDGKDFASAGVRNIQRANRVLSSVNMLTNKGDYHLHLDRPADGRFAAGDFRLRYELRGNGVSAEALDEGRYRLQAGNTQAVIFPMSGYFGDTPIRWQLGQDEDCVYLDAICYQGQEQIFDFETLSRVTISAGLEILSRDELPTQAGLLQEQFATNQIIIRWTIDEDLVIRRPIKPEALP